MDKKDRILLIDFSKVVSPIWISRHLAERFSKYLKIPKEEIRIIYKGRIWPLTRWDYSISVSIDDFVPYLKDGCSTNDLFEASKEIPPIDMNFLEWLQILRDKYIVYLASDIYEILGEAVKKELDKYFDGFILSYEEKARKSEDIFWENLQRKIDFSKIELFVDDKEKNISIAKKYGIPWLVYDASKWVESLIFAVNQDLKG